MKFVRVVATGIAILVFFGIVMRVGLESLNWLTISTLLIAAQLTSGGTRWPWEERR